MGSENNEDVLERMRAGGDDLTQPRDVHFTIVFPDEASAQAFAGQFSVGDVFIEQSNTAEGLPWDVVVAKKMIPENNAITEFEQFLSDRAFRYGGRNDGWGCFNIVSEKSIQ